MRNQPRYSLFKNARYAIEGVITAVRMETSFKLEIFFAVLLGAAIAWLPLTFGEKMVLVVTLVLVMIVELLNSAVENVVDLATDQFHPLAKNAKDMGAAAVLFSVLLHICCWAAVLVREFV